MRALLMSEYYIIPGVKKVPSDNFLRKGTYILLVGADRRPPHLALLLDGLVYALGVKGPKLDIPFDVQLRMIRRKNVKTLLVKLNISIHVHENQLFREIRKQTSMFTRAEAPVATCLSPIKNFCAGVFGVNVKEVHCIFDLLPLLYEHRFVEACYHYNLENDLDKEGAYRLGKYTMKEIYDSITTHRMAEVV